MSVVRWFREVGSDRTSVYPEQVRGDRELEPDVLNRREAIRMVVRAVEEQGMTQRDAAELVDYGPTMVNSRI